ncbi:monoamine oxidase [Catenuloplanes nepalensis]|uniref:Monoamine oxidase n=1 Tax=Catenuloplanes nepalensis TaxID=587533 RepID=A0ABT9MSI8_9ACTN|nr:FAD-dependent oxidoreductase [Catenuloplanes nepalensis]MDP9794409.1 monoamine oxidase [Catenuloplanes nepalensis]
MPIIASAVTHWADDPWTRGSWSLIGRHGTPADRVTLGTPIENRLRLAGEATHPTRAGMTHGAYEQGIAAATWAADQGHRNVIVVGAGMAGLAAAQELTGRGITTRILEARNRIGGRTTGTDVGGFTFDLGANWLQQYDDNPLARLAEKLALPVVPTEFSSGSEDLERELRERLAAAPPG